MARVALPRAKGVQARLAVVRPVGPARPYGRAVEGGGGDSTCGRHSDISIRPPTAASQSTSRHCAPPNAPATKRKNACASHQPIG